MVGSKQTKGQTPMAKAKRKPKTKGYWERKYYSERTKTKRLKAKIARLEARYHKLLHAHIMGI